MTTQLGFEDAGECANCTKLRAEIASLYGRIRELTDELRGQRLSDPEEQLGAFQRHSDTSRRAALDVYPRQGTQRTRIIECLRGARRTRDEIALFLGMTPNSVRPRLVELMDGGWVRKTTETRTTDLGSEAEVLELTDKAWTELSRRAAI